MSAITSKTPDPRYNQSIEPAKASPAKPIVEKVTASSVSALPSSSRPISSDRISPLPSSSSSSAASSSSTVSQDTVRADFLGVKDIWESFVKAGSTPVLICIKHDGGEIEFRVTSKEGLINRGHALAEIEAGHFTKTITTFDRETNTKESKTVSYITDRDTVEAELKKVNLTKAEKEQLQPFLDTAKRAPSYLASAHLRPELKRVADRVAYYEATGEQPVLYLIRRGNGRLELDCKSAKELAPDRIVNTQEHHSILDAFEVARYLAHTEQLTAREKRTFQFFTSGLQATITKMQSDGTITASLRKEMQGIIKILTPPPPITFDGSIQTYTGGTYPRAQAGVNVCDLVIANPATGTAALFDGAGHDDPELVNEQFPYYKAIATHFINHIQEFDFTQPESKKALEDSAYDLDWLYQDFFTDLLQESEKNQIPRDASLVGYKNQFAEFAQTAGQLERPSFSEEDFANFRQLIDMDRIDNRLANYEGLKKIGELEGDALAEYTALKAFRDNDFKTFIGTSHQAYMAIEFILKLSESGFRVGPAALIAQVVNTPTGPFLHTLQWSDCCYAIINPDGTMQWEKESQQSTGIYPAGDSRYVRAVSAKMVPLQPGSIVFGFTDGIGEFLTQEELGSILRTHLAEGPEAVQQAIKAAIAEHPKGENDLDIASKEDATRIRASSSRRGCKKFDPTGIDKTCCDDIGFFIMRVPGPASSSAASSSS
jgi:hypothetical protein